MDMNYIDDFAWIVKKNLFSLTGFWFDCVTSIPWSCFDLYEYLVRPPTVEDKAVHVLLRTVFYSIVQAMGRTTRL
jgi:hypothetical protein